jgi:branched-chain amino acid transport system permease protein
MLLVAVAIVMVNALLMVFGPDARNVQVDYQLDSFEVGKILIDKARLYAAAAAVLTAGGLFLFFKHSKTGKAIRACADNYLGAQVVGLNVKKYYALTFGLGGVCVAIAGCVMVLLVDVTPPLGPAYTLLAFVIVIVGGLGSMGGALLGGVLIGVSEALAGLFIAPSAKSMFSFGLLILVLLFRPQGLLGKR